MFESITSILGPSQMGSSPAGNNSHGGFRGIMSSILPFINKGLGLPSAGFNGGQPAYFNPQATQAYQNSLNNSPKALQPGSAIISSSTSNSQVQPPIPYNQLAYPGSQFAGQNPSALSGFAGQNGAQFGGYPGAGSTAGFGAGQSPGGFGGGGLGKFQMLVLPLMGAFTLIKSLFQFRSITSGLRPVKANYDPVFEKAKESIT